MLAVPEKPRYTFGMEKQKLTIPYIIRNWSSLTVQQKRGILTLVLFGAAFLLIVIALILGFSSCSCASPAQKSAAAAPEIPALLRAPEKEEEDLPEDGTGDPYDPAAVESGDPDDPDDSYVPDDEPDANETDDPGTQGPVYQTLKKGDKGEAVTQLQTRLMELGFLEIEEPTDYFGNSTEYAVCLFQRQYDLKQDGIAGEQTQSLLYSKDAKHYMMVEGSEGRDVKMLQEQLADLGYLSESDVDRIYGEKTVEAVKAFQKRNGLTADGKAGEKTLEKLFSDGVKVSKELEDKQKAEAKAAKVTPKPTAKTTSKTSSKTTPKTTPKPTPKKDTKLEKFIKAANSKLGCEYVLGDKGPNTFDCSGFVYYCLRQAGVSTTRMDAANFSKVSRWKNITSISDLKKGDILFFKSDGSSRVSHCGIYLGNNTMIDASSANGKVVKRTLSAYWKRNFVNARRPWE